MESYVGHTGPSYDRISSSYASSLVSSHRHQSHIGSSHANYATASSHPSSSHSLGHISGSSHAGHLAASHTNHATLPRHAAPGVADADVATARQCPPRSRRRPARSRRHASTLPRARASATSSAAARCHSFHASSGSDEDSIRVDLPYTHFRCRGPAGPAAPSGGDRPHVIRRFDDIGSLCGSVEPHGVVAPSYQRSSDACLAHAAFAWHLGSGRLGPEGGRLLLREGGVLREWVRAVGVVAASGTLVTLVVLGFGVSSRLIL